MTMSKGVSGAAIATAVALLFGSAVVTTAAADEAKVHCDGVNSCRGTSSCKSATNSCKGRGWSEMAGKDSDAAKAKKG